MTFHAALTPIKINQIELKNRVVRTAHGTNLGLGKITEDFIAYHLARARGGVGLTILEVLAVHSSAMGRLNAWDPDLRDGYRRLMDAIAPTGMRIFQQLWHSGNSGRAMDEKAPWAPSDVPNPLGGDVPIPMTKAMIDDVADAYGRAASICRTSGVEGVEVHAAHGYLIQQFLSPNTNLRTDEYGGTVENRSRFLLDVLRSVRDEVGRDYPVGIRLSPDLTVGGADVEQNITVLQLVEASGLVDYVNVSLGNYNSFPKMIGGMHEPSGYELPTSVPITRSTKLPTLVTGRIRTIEEADQIIRHGDADLVGMTRALIADPDIIVKTEAGKALDARPCIACNQACVGRTLLGGFEHLRCTVNPSVGFERLMAAKWAAPPGRFLRVLVIGGGPSGMQAALTAAARGHAVTLMEADKNLGGALNVASRSPGRSGIRDIATWLEEQVFKAGIDVRLNTFVDESDISDLDFEAVILATGSAPRMDGVQPSNPGEPIAGISLPHVYSSFDILTGRVDLTERKSATVVDALGHYEAIGTALYLSEAGLKVNLISNFPSMGPKVETALQNDPALERLSRRDFDLYVRHRAVEITNGAVLIAPVVSPNTRLIESDLVVFVSPNRPNTELAAVLGDRGNRFVVVGDAHSPRFLEAAIRDGYMGALSL